MLFQFQRSIDCRCRKQSSFASSESKRDNCIPEGMIKNETKSIFQWRRKYRKKLSHQSLRDRKGLIKTALKEFVPIYRAVDGRLVGK